MKHIIYILQDCVQISKLQIILTRWVKFALVSFHNFPLVHRKTAYYIKQSSSVTWDLPPPGSVQLTQPPLSRSTRGLVSISLFSPPPSPPPPPANPAEKLFIKCEEKTWNIFHKKFQQHPISIKIKWQKNVFVKKIHNSPPTLPPPTPIDSNCPYLLSGEITFHLTSC